MLRGEPDQLRPSPQLQVRQICTRGDGTSRQRERSGISDPGSEPAARLDYCLQHGTGVGIVTQLDLRVAAVRLDNMYCDRATGIKMPQLIRSQTMKGGKVFPVQQEIDRCRNQPRPAELRRQSFPGDRKLR